MKKLLFVIAFASLSLATNVTRDDVVKVPQVNELAGSLIDEYANALVSANNEFRNKLTSLIPLAERLSSEYSKVVDNAKTLVNMYVGTSQLTQVDKEELITTYINELDDIKDSHTKKDSYIILLSLMASECVDNGSNGLIECVKSKINEHTNPNFFAYVDEKFIGDYVLGVKENILKLIDAIKVEIWSRSNAG